MINSVNFWLALHNTVTDYCDRFYIKAKDLVILVLAILPWLKGALTRFWGMMHVFYNLIVVMLT